MILMLWHSRKLWAMNSKGQVVTKIQERGNVQNNRDNFRVLELFCVIYYKW